MPLRRLSFEGQAPFCVDWPDVAGIWKKQWQDCD